MERNKGKQIKNMHIPQVIALLEACIIYDTPGTRGLPNRIKHH